MKLQNKINNRFLIVLLLVFIAVGIVLYFAMGIFVNDKFDELLEYRCEKLKEKTASYPFLSTANSPDQNILIQPIGYELKKETFADTLIYDASKKEAVSYRKMTFGLSLHHQNYQITLLHSTLETEDVVEGIFYFMLGLFVVIVVVLYVLNNWISASIWKPFYATIAQLQRFKIGKNDALKFSKSNVYEFEQLNSSLNIMIEKAQTDFNNLREFTENASHEMQTPMAIIKAKLELMLQDESIASTQHQHIQSTYETVNRLSKLSESLLLLSKIENEQFTEINSLNIFELSCQKLELIEELIRFKNIDLVFKESLPFMGEINPYLAEILIHNLIGNAIKHNVEGGQIVIDSTASRFIISNTGNELTINPQKLFQRFAKNNAGSDSTGLGLAIAFEICTKYGLELDYVYQENFHYLIISKKS